MSRICTNCGASHDDDTNYKRLCRDCENAKRRHDYDDTPVAEIIEQLEDKELAEWRTRLIVEPITVKQRRTEPSARKRSTYKMISIQSPVPLTDQMRLLAKAQDMSMSAYVRLTLALHVQEHTGIPVEKLLEGVQLPQRYSERRTYA